MSRNASEEAAARRELLKKIRKIEIVTNRQVNEQLAGQYHSVFKGRGMSFDEVRQYQPGDEIRFIDWNVTARSSDVFVKRFVEERELTVMLLVDVSASLRFGTHAQYKREVAAELAALLAFSAIKNNDRVGLILFSDRPELYVPPKKGKKHVLRLITEVLSFEPGRRQTDLDAALSYLSRVAKRRAISFVVSDFHTPFDDYERSLRIAARRHDVVPIIVRDAMERELPNLGLVPTQDLETGETVWLDTASARVRSHYARETAARHDALIASLRRLKLDAVNVETGGGYVRAIVQFFQLRAKRH